MTLDDVQAISPSAPLARRASRPHGITIAAVGAVLGLIDLAVHLPVLASEPVFASINVAVTATLGVLGTFLIMSENERFTGSAFLVAGLAYPINDLDIYPGWGAWISYVFGGGALFYTSVAWGILRYGRPALHDPLERPFVAICATLTSGSGVLAVGFARPEWIGFPAGSAWFSLWPDPGLWPAATVAVSTGFVVAAIYFTLLMVRRVRATPSLRRGSLQPLAVFGSALALGSAVIYISATLAPDLVPIHTLMNLIGIFVLGLAASLVTTIVRHRLTTARAIDLLPEVTTPETANDYLRELLHDDSAELLYWADDRASLIDGHGRHSAPDTAGDHLRMRLWVTRSDGARIGMLDCRRDAVGDPASLVSLGRVLALLVQAARLSALLRMRVAQLTATRTAEQLASMKAHEEFRRNLHDGVQQTIASVRLDIDGLQDTVLDDASRVVLAAATDKLSTALDQIRNLKSGTAPPELRFGLKPAMERCIAELRLEATVDIPDGDLGIMTMPVYYIARECLTNVHKHAEAAHVAVSVTTAGPAVTVVIRDDGRGGAAPRTGGGLAGVAERVRDLSGVLSVDSRPGAGTTVRAVVPLVR